jgi:hypothetical protein
MSSSPPIRASDRDRERTASQLREHHALGRLDAQEYHDRLDKVYEAKTVADLDELTADLPVVDIYPLPSASLRRHHVRPGLPASSVLSQMEAGIERLPSTAWPAAWGGWLVVTFICVVLLLTGNPWPLAWAGIAGAVMAGGWMVRRARRHGGGTAGPTGG